MRSAYRQFDAGPIVNLARNHPRGTGMLSTGQFPKFHADRWGGDGTYSLITGVTGHPDGITTAARFTVTATARNGHGWHIAGNCEQQPPIGLSQMLPAKPGERITMSCWLRYTGTSTQAYRIRFRPGTADGSAWVDNGSEQALVSLPSGVWVRLSYTYTAPPGTGAVAIYVTNNNGQVDAIGDTIDATGLMVTRPPAPRGNLATDPNATALAIPTRGWGWVAQWFGSGGTGTTAQVTNAADGPDGITTYLRKTWATIGTNLADVAFTHTNNSGRPPVAAGETYTISSYFRASKGWTVTSICRVSVQWYDSAGVQVGATAAGANLPAVIAGTWHKVSITATAPAGAATIRVIQDVHVQSGTWAAGDTIDGTGLVITKDPPSWRYGDGDSPGWRWLGAAKTSESAGPAIPG